MKLLKLTAFFMLISSIGYTQNNNLKTIFEVDGVCGMCKKRIEKASLKTKGVKSAIWNLETHKLQVIYDEQKVDVETIKSNVSAAGHDTNTVKASNKAYGKLFKCCKYRDLKVIEEHKL